MEEKQGTEPNEETEQTMEQEQLGGESETQEKCLPLDRKAVGV